LRGSDECTEYPTMRLFEPLRTQRLPQQFVHTLRTSLSAGSLHDLGDQKTERRHLARAVLRDGIVVVSKDVGNQRCDLRLVVYLTQPLGSDNLVGRPAG